MESKVLGKIKSHEFDPDLYFGEPIEIPYFDNLKISVGIGDAAHEPSLIEADQVLSDFMKLNSEDKIGDSEIVVLYYKECLKYGISKPLEITHPSDIWDFIRPSEIIVDSLMGEGFFVNISCGCDWELEHGLQLVFKNGTKLIRAGGHE